MEIKNMTPHKIVIFDDNRNVIQEFESEGSIRIETTVTPIGKYNNMIPVTLTTYRSNFTDLPERKPGVIYIVSKIVCESAMHRSDFYIPNEMVKDEKGRTIGCKSIALNPSYDPQR